MYKCKLNELCQKQGYEPPQYSYTKYGQDHDPLYKAQVFFNGSTFKSSSAFKSHKLVDNDVAEVATSHYLTFSLPIDGDDVMHKTKRLKACSSLSLSSSFHTGAPNETSEPWLPVLPKDTDTKVASFDHSLLSITEPNSIESINTEPNPIKSMDVLSNKIGVYTGISDKMLTRGTIIEPNSIESINTEPNPIKSMDVLSNKIGGYTGISDKMLTRGNVAY